MYKSLIMTAMALCLISNISFGEPKGVLSDADMPLLKDALKKAYTPELCQKDLPNASTKTCDCIRDEMANNLNVEKLKLCKQEGYDECVVTEFAAAKSSLTEKQINDCKTPSPTAIAPEEEKAEGTPEEVK